MASLNKLQFIGNAGADPEVRSFDNGNKIAQVRLAVSERYTDRNGQVQTLTEWIPLVFNGKLADIAAQYIVKGSSIYVEGRWKTRKWTDQQNVEHTQVEMRVDTLQLLSPRPQAQAQAPQAQRTAPAQAPAPQYPAAPQYQKPAAPQYAPAPQYPATPQPEAQSEGNDPDLPF